MGDIDKAVELAREIVAVGDRIEGVAADIALDLARAVLAMAEDVARLRAALSDAYDLAAEGISYTSDYHLDKWEMPQRLAAIQAALDAEARRG